MKKILEMFVALALLAAADVAAAQQVSPPATAPAQSATQPPQAPVKPALKLRLDEIERRPAMTFGPKNDGKKNDAAAQSLPGLGGRPSWGGNPDPSTIVPPTNDNL